MSRTIIPAQPGFSAVEPVYDRGAVVQYDLTPIIAWAIEGQGADVCVTPISAAGFEVRTVIYPDGSVETDVGHKFKSLDAWFKEVKA